MTATALVSRATIEQIVGYRDRAIELYESAWTKIADADAAIKEAQGMARLAAPSDRAFLSEHAREIQEFYAAVKLPDQEKYTRVARRIIDTQVWAWVLQMTDLERLMDAKAKDELRAQMRYVPERVCPRTGQLINEDELAQMLPPATVENIYSTIEHFRAMSDTIFVRGIANVFSGLDRRFRSHDGFKIGSRVILFRAFSDWGSMNGRTRDALVDIERTFSVLDKRKGTYTEAVGRINEVRGYSGNRQTECETDYFTIRTFKNGNAHLWFKRDDLVQEVNRLLASYYGEVLGDKEVEEDDPLANMKLTPARRFGFFPTPDAGVRDVMAKVAMRSETKLRVLEPSAGTGNLASACLSNGMVDCCEIQGHLADDLRRSGKFNRVWCADFLSLTPQDTGFFDRVVMNPPFDRERDIDHVTHAMRFLKPGGQLVSIMSAGTEYRETRKSKAFRALMKGKNAVFYDMPAGSFAELGTNVNTIILVVWNDGSSVSGYSAWNAHRFDNGGSA